VIHDAQQAAAQCVDVAKLFANVCEATMVELKGFQRARVLHR
jgi:hypothetical protein